MSAGCSKAWNSLQGSGKLEFILLLYANGVTLKTFVLLSVFPLQGTNPKSAKCD